MLCIKHQAPTESKVSKCNGKGKKRANAAPQTQNDSPKSKRKTHNWVNVDLAWCDAVTLLLAH